MKPSKTYLGQFEEIVLLATLNLSDAYGVTIRQAVEEALEKPVSIGAIYSTLDRLERKGFMTSWQGDATAERGGRAKRHFKVEGHGIRALKDNEAARVRLSTDRRRLNPLGEGIA